VENRGTSFPSSSFVVNRRLQWVGCVALMVEKRKCIQNLVREKSWNMAIVKTKAVRGCSSGY
jgi:hypothetical protein